MTTATVLARDVEITGLRRDFKTCHAMAEAARRLACYDDLQRSLEPPDFQGSLSEETPPFTVVGSTLLRYQSDGPIFVMYLDDAQGRVVQNLHIGGGGEASFLIVKSGTYRLQVSGSDKWRIWLEPQADTKGRPRD